MAHRKQAAVLAAAATLFIVPQANASADEYLVFLGSVDVGTGVWAAGMTAGAPVNLAGFDDDAAQRWHWDPEAGTFRNALTKQCLTANGGVVIHDWCDDQANAQRWVRQPIGDPAADPSLFSNEATGACVRHNGVDEQLLLAACDPVRVDQQWHIYLW